MSHLILVIAVEDILMEAHKIPVLEPFGDGWDRTRSK